MNSERVMEILLVEDNRTDRLLTASALADTRPRCRLHTAVDGEQALRFMRQAPPFQDAPRPDLILLDLNLPKIDGRSVLRQLKSEPYTRNIPVLILTNSNAHADIEAAYTSFANGYIRKPVSFEAFSHAIRVTLDYWFQVGTLPPAPPAPPRERQAPPVPSTQLTIMVVEDSPTDRLLLRNHLTNIYNDSSTEIVFASSLTAARDVLETSSAQVILTDLNLPDSRGLETLTAIRAIQPDAAIIVLTGGGFDSAGRDATRAGADDYLVKDDISTRSLHRAVEHAQERRHLQAQLQEASRHRLVARLAGYLAHDLNNLFTVIRAETSCIMAGGVDEEALLGTIEATQRGERLTRQLLAHGRQQPIRPRRTDLGQFLIRQRGILQRLAGNDINVGLEIPRDLPEALVDRTATEFMLYNLTTNAVDAMPDGGRIRLSVAPRGEHVELIVADTGTGMPHDLLTRVMEPFFTTKDVTTGSGLGLSAVRDTIQAHGGTIRIDSVPERGTTVHLFFPVVASVVGTANAEGARGQPTENRQILVVDDEPAVLRAVARGLRNAGFRAMTAPTAEDAIKIARNETVDLLLTDVVLGPLDRGPELAERLKEGGYDGPVLYMSGYVAEYGGENGPFTPGVNFIQKPFEPADLYELIRRVFAAPKPVT